MTSRYVPGPSAAVSAACAIVAVLVLSTVSCLSKPPPAPCDSDADGFPVAECELPGPADCDDSRATVFPGQREVCGDAVDDDCSGSALACSEEIPALSVDATETQITGGGLYLELDPDQGFAPRVLKSTKGSDQNLLHTAHADPIDMKERLIGISHWSNWFSWESSPATRETLENHDTIVRMRITWATGGSADSPGMSGTSVYTVLPDGRIHRDENIEIEIQHPSDNVWLTAYIAMNPERIDRIDWAGNSGSPYQVGPRSGACCNDPPEPSYLCGYHSETGDRIGWAYRLVSLVDDTLAHGPRATESEIRGPESHQVALQYDFARSAPVAIGDYHVNLLMHAGTVDDDGDACSGILAHAAGFLEPAELSFAAPGKVVADGSGDDDADGYNEGGGFYHLSAEGSASIELTIDRQASVQAPSYAFRIDGLDLSGPSWVEINGQRQEHGSDYLVSGDAQGGWLFVAADLPNGATLRVATLGSLR